MPPPNEALAATRRRRLDWGNRNRENLIKGSQMTDKPRQTETERQDVTARRRFLKKAAAGAIATPAAVVLLLSAGTKRARAGDY